MVPASAGTPQYSGNFIPEIWSGQLLVKYYTASIFPGFANTKYEGEIKNQGDIVNIRTRADININDYVKGMELVIQHPDNPMITFPIRKAKYFNFICDDIDKHQADINLMEDWSQDAGEQMKIVIDAQGLGDIYADGHADNVGTTAGAISGGYNMGVSGSPVAITKENVLDFMMDMNSCLDEKNVPESGRSYALPTWMNNMLKKSDLKDVSMTGDSKSSVRHGRVGSIDGLDVLKSNQIKKVTDGSYTCYYPMCVHNDAITFAAQMREMDSLKSEKTFGRLVRGLNVYDYKTIKSEGLVVGYVRKA
jgi:hypothetical protein